MDTRELNTFSESKVESKVRRRLDELWDERLKGRTAPEVPDTRLRDLQRTRKTNAGETTERSLMLARKMQPRSPIYGARSLTKRRHDLSQTTTSSSNQIENQTDSFNEASPKESPHLVTVRVTKNWESPYHHEPSHLSLPVTYQARERRYLPLEMNGKTTYAVPDNALIGNAMTEEWAKFVGAEIEHLPYKQSFVNAQGQVFEPIGQTRLIVSIPELASHSKSERKWKCSFAVVKQLAAPLVLGASFLRETETFTSLAHLLVKKTLSVTKGLFTGLRTVRRFMHMDLRTQHLDCFLDNEQLLVSLDTGSDIDAVSLDYARSRSWQIQPLPEDEAYVLLANNELVKLSGYIETTLRMQPRSDSKQQCVPKRLFVLDGLVRDVVLGDSTIETLDIFNEYENSIIDTTEPEGMDAFRMIQWIEKIDRMAGELERMMLNNQDVENDALKQKRRSSILRWIALRKKAPVDPEEISQRLKGILEVFDVCSANWRRTIEPELSNLVGQEHARRKEEIERRKERNKQIRDRILSLIRDRPLSSTPGSSSGSTTPSPPG